VARSSQSLMDACGNDAPLLWMLHRPRLRPVTACASSETETERQLRLEREGRIRAEQALAEVLKRMPGGV
jgi:hypothetical protein